MDNSASSIGTGCDRSSFSGHKYGRGGNGGRTICVRLVPDGWYSHCLLVFVLIRASLRKKEEEDILEEVELNMALKYIIGSVAASFTFAYVCSYYVEEKKIFGGNTPKTVATSEWWEATDKQFQAWPRTAGPPVVMNPLRRQNFIVKSSDEKI